MRDKRKNQRFFFPSRKDTSALTADRLNAQWLMCGGYDDASDEWNALCSICITSVWCPCLCGRKRRLSARQNYAGKKMWNNLCSKIGSIPFGSIDVHKYMILFFFVPFHFWVVEKILSTPPFGNASDEITNVSAIGWRPRETLRPRSTRS